MITATGFSSDRPKADCLLPVATYEAADKHLQIRGDSLRPAAPVHRTIVEQRNLPSGMRLVGVTRLRE
jgi:hypothetical protein